MTICIKSNTWLLLLMICNSFLQICEAERVYVGCFTDDSNRLYDFPNPFWDTPQQTVSKCARYCKSRNFIYSGLEFKSQCFCGNVEPLWPYHKKSDSECNMACGGNSGEKCGGEWRLSIYKDCSVLSPYPQNCAKIDCKTRTDKRCTACTEKEYYKVVDRDCKDKCSSRNRWCWPGSCENDLVSNCHCMTGFKLDGTTATCQPIKQPSIANCQTFAIGRNGSKAVSNTGSPECSFQKDIYGSFQVGHFQINLNVFFQVTIGHQYKDARPRFVPQEQFGITDLHVDVYKLSVTNQSQFVIRKFVKSDPKSEHLEDTVSSKNVTVYANEMLADGERLCLTFNAKAGGYLISKDEIIHNKRTNIPYKKTEMSKQLCYIYDKVPPSFDPTYHSTEPLTLSKRLTTSNHIKAYFGGWFDPYPVHGTASLASGIESYAIRVYEVKEATETTLMRDTTSVAGPFNYSKDETEVDILLPDKNPMLYAILLEVKDRADNVRQARRFVLYDNSSKIVKNELLSIRVDSASNLTNFIWQIHHESICYSWKNRFFNNYYKKNNPLRHIRTEARNSTEGMYDQMSGVLPVTGTPNIYGLTDFFYFLLRNERNVDSGKVRNFAVQSLCLKPIMNDGDTFLLRLQVRDIMNHTLNDSIKVHIDRSVPEISDIWLIRNGRKQLYIHHSSDLSVMLLEFKAFDLHSGIREIRWAFGINENKTVLIEKSIAVEETNNSSSCTNATTCYCPMVGECTSTTYVAELKKLKTLNKHNGNHNRRYFFMVTAINNAHLVAYDHIDILVDESPPEVGVVLEGPVGSSDIDYTHQ